MLLYSCSFNKVKDLGLLNDSHPRVYHMPTKQRVFRLSYSIELKN